MVRWPLAILLLALCSTGNAQDSPTTARTTTLATLFPAAEAKALDATLAADQPLRYRVRMPRNAALSGVLVFVKPIDSGELPDGWAAGLDRQNLIWIAAEDFGNDRSRAQRILAAIAGLKLIESTQAIDRKRVYIGGMSGGGRIASQTITRFPQRFTGALYIVGADFRTSAEEPQKALIAANRYVFVTGSHDFNQRDMRRAYSKYQRAGVTHSLLMDIPGLGHEYPDPGQLEQAIDFLDAR
jgi:predicted esterase